MGPPVLEPLRKDQQDKAALVGVQPPPGQPPELRAGTSGSDQPSGSAGLPGAIHEATKAPGDASPRPAHEVAEGAMKPASASKEDGDTETRRRLRAAFCSVDADGQKAVKRESVERVFHNCGVKVPSADALDTFTDPKTGLFTYEDYLSRLHDLQLADSATPKGESAGMQATAPAAEESEVATSCDAMEAGGTVSARQQDLKEGARACICGLEVNSDANGLECTLEKWDEKDGRWLVRLDDDNKRWVRPVNLRVKDLVVGMKVYINGVPGDPGGGPAKSDAKANAEEDPQGVANGLNKEPSATPGTPEKAVPGTAQTEPEEGARSQDASVFKKAIPPEHDVPGTKLIPRERVSPNNLDFYNASQIEEGSTCTDQPSDPKQTVRAVLAAALLALTWLGILAIPYQVKQAFEEPICDEDKAEEKRVCERCSSGTVVLPLYGEFEQSWPTELRAVLYFAGLIWVFLGAGIICDKFMEAIEVITSTEVAIWKNANPGSQHRVKVKVWNSTMANLTLMALGSSAPEILLSLIEVSARGFKAGDLGPSTIVGSAAFNLLVISAVCVSALGDQETKKIVIVDVFVVTALFSLFAYVWLVLILQYISPNRVELWEATATLCFFPLLLFLALVADKGYIRQLGRRSTSTITEFPRNFPATTCGAEALAFRMSQIYGKDLPVETLELLSNCGSRSGTKDSLTPTAKTKGKHSLMCTLTGGSTGSTCNPNAVRRASSKGSPIPLVIGFERESYMVVECERIANIRVVSNQAPQPCSVRIHYRTRDGSAKEGVRYQQTEGVLNFRPNQKEALIQVPLIDDNQWQAKEDFSLELYNVQADNNHLPRPIISVEKTTVLILNDDRPGILGFDYDEIYARRGHQHLTVGVVRSKGSSGRITVEYETVSGTAKGGKDFVNSRSSLTFEHGDVSQTIELRLQPSGQPEPEKSFVVRLFDPCPEGVKFSSGRSDAHCLVVIPATQAGLLHGCGECCSTVCSADGLEDWYGQFAAAFYCKGSNAEQAAATCLDWFCHCLALPWKILFAFTPPPSLCGGWLCFVVALIMIGVVTAVVGDMASLLGCCVNIPNEITAITLVAMGTSLPDTFASKYAAQEDDSADNAVGNITGSNSVNVFLGLGISWTVAAVYWHSQGETFYVPAGKLVFSVTVFVACALVCISVLTIRRWIYGGELGGPKSAQHRDSAILASLWVVYIVATCIQSLGSN